jgi:two-component sensor histidine kinase
MYIEEHLLKGKYFPEKSTERLKSTMVVAFILLIVPFIFMDAYGSYMQEHFAIAIIEVAFMAILLIAYLLFPHYITLEQMIDAALIVFIVLMLLLLFMWRNEPGLVIFSMSTLPIFIFFFLGVSDGIKWSILVLSIFIVIVIGGFFDILHPNLSATLLAKMTVAYAAISYLLYIIEKERSEKEEELRSFVEDNKLLFKEVHHRTKNNMQVMMGMLETQSFKIKDPKYKKMFAAHVDRIKSMSYVHENLYKGASAELVDMHKYLNEILSNLQRVTQHTIMIDIEYMTMGIKDSISLGLIVNEAVSNAIEHAYSAGSQQIDVTLKFNGKQHVLTVEDYGLGFNTKKEFQSLGMTLIEDLSQSLPNGRLDINVDNGTRIQIYFDAKED